MYYLILSQENKEKGKTVTRTIQNIIDLIVATVPEAPQKDSVDTLKCGDPSQPVTGIITTFTATVNVLRQAVQQRANLIITHEPTFYEHRDRTYWLAEDPVYLSKHELIEQHKLAIWRFHDYWHLHQPDGILTGIARALGWEPYQHPDNNVLFIMPATTIGEVAATVKARLVLPQLRIVGEPQQRCERIALLVGAIGGEAQIHLFHYLDADLVICGETVEWQTCEYVRDAIALGYNKALLILGHAKSEEQGMHYLAEWLQPKVPEIPITYIPVGDPVKTL
jgi:putative NIF3 family GTP cyclohydrolase 1 type 2